MKSVLRAGWLIVAVVGVTAWLLPALDAAAVHTVFTYRVDRFELDGNALGPMDGMPEIVDDFDDGALYPNWYRAFGTVAEADGFLVLSNPGTHFPGPNGEEFDLSVAGSTGSTFVHDEMGSFTATAYWERLIPQVSQHHHFSLFTFGPSGGLFAETFGIGIRQSDTALEIEQHLTEIDQVNGIWRNTMLTFHPISAADITDRIGFRIHFDDLTNMAKTSYSLDGGRTWHSPFQSGQIFVGRSTAQFLLSADPSTAVSIPAGPCTPAGCRRSTVPGQVLLKMLDRGDDAADLLDFKLRRGQETIPPEFGDPLGTTTYEVCIGDAAGNPVFRAEIPPGGFCGGKPCWKRQGRKGYQYKNPAGQISQLRLAAGADGRALVLVKGKGAGIDPPALARGLPATVRVMNAAGTCWAAVFTASGVIRNTPTDFAGKAGSPSGAFLD